MKIPVSGIIRVKWDKDVVFYLGGNQTCFVTRLLFWEGVYGYDYPLMKIFSRLVIDYHVFIDVGANVGYYSILASKLNPNAKVYAFEPSPGSFQFLSNNLKQNNLQNVYPSQLAISNSVGETSFYQHITKKVSNIDHQLGGSSSLILDEEKRENFESIIVKTTTLDKFIESNAIRRVDIIKIDTEATEHHVLEGASVMIAKFKPIIICEVLKDKIERSLETLFRQLGYKFFFVTDKGLLYREDLRLSIFKEDVFFVHPDKYDKVSEFVAK